MRSGMDSSAFALYGPLGANNMRRQQGKSVELGGANTGKGLAETLVFSGAPGKLDSGVAGIGDALATVLTISTTIDVLSANVADAPIVRGVVQWGSDGHQASAEFDWKRGTVIQVCGSFVSIAAQIEQGTADSLVRVGAFVGYYAATRAAPTYTLIGDIAASPAAGSDAFIPNFASRVHVAPNVTGATYSVELRNAAGVVLSFYTQAAFATGGSVPIPNGATTVRVTSAGIAFDAAVIYELAI